jgi:hypothetical protein
MTCLSSRSRLCSMTLLTLLVSIHGQRVWSQAVIQCSQIVQGHLEIADLKEFTFAASAGDTVSIVLPDVYAAVFDLFGPHRQIVKDPVGNPFENRNSLGGDGLSLPMTGTYTVRVHDEFFNDIRDFALSLEWLFRVPLPEVHFIRGDSSRDFCVDLSDAIYTLTYLFLGGSDPACLDAADVDDSGKLDLTDAIYTLSFLFLGGQAPSTPFPVSGTDPTPDDLGCVPE